MTSKMKQLANEILNKRVNPERLQERADRVTDTANLCNNNLLKLIKENKDNPDVYFFKTRCIGGCYNLTNVAVVCRAYINSQYPNGRVEATLILMSNWDLFDVEERDSIPSSFLGSTYLNLSLFDEALSFVKEQENA